MATEMAVPFAIDPLGQVATTDSLAQQMINHIVSIIGTNLYERKMMPLYGIDTDAYLFDSNDDIAESTLIADISVAIADYEPGVVVSNIAVVPSPDEESTTAIQVSFNLVTAAAVSSATFTATVSLDGSVVG